MRRHFDVLEEKRIGKVKDTDIFKKLIEFARPYWKIFLFTVFLLLGTTIFELGMPYIMKSAIDKTLMPTAKKLVKHDKITNNIKLKYPNAFYKDMVILYRLPLAVKKDLEKGKYLSKTSYFVIPIKKEAISILRKHNLSYYREKDLIFIEQHKIYSLPKRELRILRSYHYSLLVKFAFLYLLFLFLDFVFTFLQVYYLQYFGQLVMYDLRMAIFKKIMRLPVSFFDKNPTGRIVTRATNDVNAINEMFSAVLVYAIKDLFLLTGILIVMFKLSPVLSWKVIIFVPFIIALSLLFQKLARKAYRNVRSKLSKINAFTQESISQIDVIHLFYAMKKMIKRYREINHELYRANMQQMYVYAFFRPLMEMLRVVAVATIVYFGGKGIFENYVTFGTFVAFLSYIDMFFSPIRDLAEKYNILQSSFAAGERILLLLDEEEEKRNGTIVPDKIKGQIDFENVWFSYDGERWVLKDITFHVNEGTTVAIVGPTGAGKTSTISLLARFYEHQRGVIKIDKEKIENFEVTSLRKNMAFVFQDVFIFKGSVRKNIALWDKISEEEIEEALRLTYAKEFIDNLPDGLDTELGERGVTLSMGQRQLLSFARAIVRKPSILVLDEATSNIDTYTEHLIEKALSNLLSNRTAIVIAHRLSTIKNADKILVILDGTLKEEGTHKELLQKEGVYAKLYKIQFELAKETS